MPKNLLKEFEPEKFKGTINVDNIRQQIDPQPVAKTISLKQGTIQHTPTNAKDIANKAYADSAATPAGSDTQVQYNNGGAFGGSSDFVFNDSTGAITTGGSITTGGNVLIPATSVFRTIGTPYTELDLSLYSQKWDCSSNSYHLTFEFGSENRLQLTSSEVVFNETGDDRNFRIEGDNDTTCFKVDAGVDSVGISTGSFDSTGRAVFAIGAGTEPAASVANVIQFYAKDSSDGKDTLGLYTDQEVESIGTFTASNKLKIWINGTEYWIQLDAV